MVRRVIAYMPTSLSCANRAWMGDARTGSPRWSWARLLKRMFDLDMATCPLCQRGSLRIMAVITQEVVITRMLRYLKLAAVPPPSRLPILTKKRSTG